MSKAKTSTRPRTSSPKSIVVTIRVSVAEAKRLDEIQAMSPALPTRAAALRRLIRLVTDDDLTTTMADAESWSSAVTVTADDDKIIAALDRMTDALHKRTIALDAIGHNVNQLTRLAHQVAKWGRAGAVPLAAVQAVDRALKSIKKEMLADTILVTGVQQVIELCRRT